MTSSISGLSSGLDTNSIVNQLMQLERRPQVALTQRRDTEERARTELSEIRSDITALRNQAADLRLSSGWDKLTVSSSNEDAVSVSATSASNTGSYSFQVSQVATAASVYSDQVFTSLDEASGASGPPVFSAAGYQALGFSTIAGQNFPEGPVTIEVVQGSEPAKTVGGIPTIPITIDGTNDSIDLEVSGFTFTVSIDHGSYDSEQAMANALSSAIAGHAQASTLATASLNENDEIVLATKAEGSSQSVLVIGGSLTSALGYVPGDSGTGVDAVVEVNGVANVLDTVKAGDTATLVSDGAGTVDVTLSDSVVAGSITATQTDPASSGSTGGVTLSELVTQVNEADLGYTAFAVNTGDGYRLQLTANEPGADSAVDTSAGFGSLTFTELTAGQDAVLTIQGDNPLTIKSSDNVFDQLLPGVNITVNAVTDVPVTVTTERDVEAVADSIGELVTKFNELSGRIGTATDNNPGSEAVLQGNREVRRALDELRTALVGPVDGNAFSSVGMVGLELSREGTINFDRATFVNALESDPNGLSALFADRTADGSGQPGAIDRLIEAAQTSTATGTGYLYTAGEAAERRIEDFTQQIDSFERRMELRESTLRRTYANLEVALGGMQQEQAWLSSQLASLGGGSIL